MGDGSHTYNRIRIFFLSLKDQAATGGSITITPSLTMPTRRAREHSEHHEHCSEDGVHTAGWILEILLGFSGGVRRCRARNSAQTGLVTKSVRAYSKFK